MKNWDPGQYIITFGEVVLTAGFAPDTFATYEPADTLYTTQVGASGEVVRSRSRNASGTFTVRLMQSSGINDQLSVLKEQDRLFGTGVRTLQVRDLNGTEQLTAAEAWIQDRPRVERGKEAGENEWVFAGAKWVETFGGATP